MLQRRMHFDTVPVGIGASVQKKLIIRIASEVMFGSQASQSQTVALEGIIDRWAGETKSSSRVLPGAPRLPVSHDGLRTGSPG